MVFGRIHTHTPAARIAVGKNDGEANVYNIAFGMRMVCDLNFWGNRLLWSFFLG